MPELRCFRKECTLFVLPQLEVPTFGYELRIARSTSEDQHPMHLHWLHSRFRGPAKKEMSDLFKDAVNVMPLDRVAVDFVQTIQATHSYCHQQLHIDYGCMQLISYSR